MNLAQLCLVYVLPPYTSVQHTTTELYLSTWVKCGFLITSLEFISDFRNALLFYVAYVSRSRKFCSRDRCTKFALDVT